MNLADKPVYATIGDSRSQNFLQEGLTYKQWLVGMLASNPNMVDIDTAKYQPSSYAGQERLSSNAETIINQADAIIKELEKQQ